MSLISMSSNEFNYINSDYGTSYQKKASEATDS